MTKSTSSYVSQGTTITTYKALYGVVSAQAQAVMPRTADTGQVNWTTIATMPGQVIRDYDVLAFTDALQATKPIYVRLDYEATASSTHRVLVSVGSATNGAGVLSGSTVAAFVVGTFAPSSGNTRYCYASSDGSYLMLVWNLQGPSGTGTDGLCGFVIERTRDVDGTPNSNGYVIWSWSGSSEPGIAAANYFSGCQARAFDPTINNDALMATYDPSVFIPNLINTSTGLVGSVAYAYPAYGFTNVPQGASKALMLAFQGDYPRQSTVTLTHYGTTMTFLPLGPSAVMSAAYSSAVGTAAAKTGLSPLFRWE